MLSARSWDCILELTLNLFCGGSSMMEDGRMIRKIRSGLLVKKRQNAEISKSLSHGDIRHRKWR